ncbi:sporulation protein YjcZ [Paenibacillus sp. HB172176]|nr:sporulation protein YjcZ [Paenibacillus sp. HB172176]
MAGASCNPVGGAFTSTGSILVLFILLVIITRACLY